MSVPPHDPRNGCPQCGTARYPDRAQYMCGRTFTKMDQVLVSCGVIRALRHQLSLVSSEYEELASELKRVRAEKKQCEMLLEEHVR